MKNPYFNEVAGGVTVGRDRDSWSDNHIENLTARGMLVERYAWAIPNELAIAAIVEGSPILEVGAGKGYWAWLISQEGGDIIATDPDPPTSDVEWHPVWKARAQDVVPDYPDRSLLMVWPNYDDSWSVEALGMYEGDKVYYVGEGRDGRTGPQRFHEMLYEDYHRTETIAIPSYMGIHDALEIWEPAE